MGKTTWEGKEETPPMTLIESHKKTETIPTLKFDRSLITVTLYSTYTPLELYIETLNPQICLWMETAYWKLVTSEWHVR